MKKLRVLIPDAESGHALIVIRCLSRVPNIEIHIMGKRQNVSSRYSRYIKSFAHIPNHSQNYIEFILEQVKKKGIDLILPIDEPAHRIFTQNVDLVQNYCKTSPLPQPDTFETVVNKWKLGQFCEKNNIAFPKSYIINGQQDVENLHGLDYPMIIKPESGHGGNNISIINSYDELNGFLNSNPDKSMGNYILQDFIEGYDIDMSLLAKDGEILAYTIQKGFLKRSNEFAASAGIEFLYEEKLFRMVEKLIDRLNFSGIAHLDLRYDQRKRDFKLIEINARYWGSLTGSLMAGINFPELACKAGMGQKIEIPEYRFIRYITYSSAIKSKLFHPFSKASKKIKLKESDLKYILRDPLAEVKNILQRRRSNLPV